MVLIAKKQPNYESSSYSTPLVNLSSVELTSVEIKQFKFGLQQGFVDKNKNIKKYLPGSFEFSADKNYRQSCQHQTGKFS